MKKFIWPSGPIGFRLTNDVLFKYMLQRNKEVLQEMICSLLSLDRSQIIETEVINPILEGQKLEDKTLILDVNILMNDNTTIDLEMQVQDYKDWPERSLTYAVRNLDTLQKGDLYLNLQPSVHIGFLSYTLFKDRPKFYSVNMIMDVEDQHIYTNKLMIGVVDLTRIDLATEKDKRNHLDKWARFFKAKTWEELKMLSKEYSTIEEAARCIKGLTEEKYIRMQMEAREDQLRRENWLMQTKEQAEQRADQAEQRADHAEQRADQAEQRADQAEQRADQAEKEIEQLRMELQRLNEEKEHILDTIEES